MSTFKQRLMAAAVDVLFLYRKWCANPSSSGQLILPEALKLLPLYALALLKHPCFRVNDPRDRHTPRVRADERAFVVHSVLAAPVATSIVGLYPRLHSLLDLEDNPHDASGPPLSRTLSPSAEHLASSGVFLLDCGTTMFVLVGDQVPGDAMRDLFQPSAEPAPPAAAGGRGGAARQPLELVPMDNDLSRKVHSFIDTLRRDRFVFPDLKVSQRMEPAAAEFMSLLVEDKTGTGVSYAAYLCAIHKEIQNKIHNQY